MPGPDRRRLLRLGGAAALAPLVGGLASGCEDAPVKRARRLVGAQPYSYGPDSSQFCELTLPKGTPKGVVVVIHGGFWKATYDLSLGRPLSTSLAEHGWAAWNIEYRRVGNGGGDPATFDDVAAAVDALVERGLDLSRVIALGHSAGGHLAAWAASRGRDPRWQPKVTVTGVVSQAGVLDLRTAYDDSLGDGAVEAFLGHRPGPADKPLDPQQQIPLAIPVHCIHGSDDPIVPISQSQQYVAAAKAVGARAELTTIKGGDHFVLIDSTSDAWRQTLAILDGL